MKTIRFIAAMMFFAAIATTSIYAQGTTAAVPRVAIINTADFGDEKAGITRFVNAYKQMGTEFKSQQDAITAMETRLRTIADDIKKVQAGGAVVDPKTIASKQEEGEKLQREYNFKVEELKSAVARREQSLVGPIYQDIGKAIQDYAKQKGYSIVFDPSKDQNGVLLWADMSQVDVTADFIKFYNARPAGTASAAPASTTPASTTPARRTN